MIRFENLTKVFNTGGQRKVVIDNLSLEFPSGSSVALLGRNGAGKSTFLSLIASNVAPTSGRIISDGKISWPVGFAGSFHGDLTGAQNARFVARIYGVDSDEVVLFVQHFSELGASMHLPFRTYSAGMRSRLAFAVSMAIPFDTYLIDEITAVGDASFREKSSALFKERMQSASSVVVSHSMQQVRELCNAAAVLEDGQITYFEDVDAAIALHSKNMQKPRG